MIRIDKTQKMLYGFYAVSNFIVAITNTRLKSCKKILFNDSLCRFICFFSMGINDDYLIN